MTKSKYLALEIVAVLCGAAYTLLISYGSIWCWLFAIISSISFIYLCYQKNLLAETSLHTFYLAMGFYGYYSWGNENAFTPSFTSIQNNIAFLIGGIFLFYITGYLLKKKFNAALPYLDSFTTVFSIIATFLMIEMLTENWAYWIVIDLVSVYLYSKRGLILSAFLYLVYVGLAINGLINWL